MACALGQTTYQLQTVRPINACQIIYSNKKRLHSDVYTSVIWDPIKRCHLILKVTAYRQAGIWTRGIALIMDDANAKTGVKSNWRSSLGVCLPFNSQQSSSFCCDMRHRFHVPPSQRTPVHIKLQIPKKPPPVAPR